ncbi:MAG: hypothetical protein ACRBB4_01015 [Neptuniibacter sp.]
MDINLFNKQIRNAVNSASLSSWASAKDKKSYCRDLLGQVDEHEVIIDILTNVVQDLLEHKAEDIFATFRTGDGVSILGNGQSRPATITRVEENSITIQPDKVSQDGVFITDPDAESIVFQRAHDQVFIHKLGNKFSRLKMGRRLEDYSSDRISASLNHLVSITPSN